VVYDRPHIPNQGRVNQKDFHDRFGVAPARLSSVRVNFSIQISSPAASSRLFEAVAVSGTEAEPRAQDAVAGARAQAARVRQGEPGVRAAEVVP